MVYEGDYALTGINKHGRVYSPDPDLPEEISGEHSIFAMRNGDETIVSLPNDHEYSLLINADDSRDVSFLDVIVTPEDLVPDKVTIHMARFTNGGVIMMDAVPGEPLTEPEVFSGNYHHVGDTEYTYSPTVIMRNELQATKGAFLSLGTAITLLRVILGGLAVMLTVCLIIGVRHRRKVKRGEHAPYSNLYVIIPHSICIVVAAALTQFSTFFLYTLPAARVQCATVTMIFLTLLSIRGFLRSKKPMAFLVAVLMGMLTYCTKEFFNDSELSTFSVINMLAYFALIALLTGIACWTFRREEKDKIAGLGKAAIEKDSDAEKDPAKESEETPEKPAEKPAKEAKKTGGKTAEKKTEKKKPEKKKDEKPSARPDYLHSDDPEKDAALEQLWQLMVKDMVYDPTVIQAVVAEKEYYDLSTPIRDYDIDFIEGCLIEAWDKVLGLALTKQNDLPF